MFDDAARRAMNAAYRTIRTMPEGAEWVACHDAGLSALCALLNLPPEALNALAAGRHPG